jgi:hypothetical protein
MAMKSSIIAGIEFKVGPSMGYSSWRIGLTHDPEERKKYWRFTEAQDIDRWSEWQANSLAEAEDIALSFADKGMQGGPSGNLSRYKPVYVYVF